MTRQERDVIKTARAYVKRGDKVANAWDQWVALRDAVHRLNDAKKKDDDK